jgi:hypothetical protein
VKQQELDHGQYADFLDRAATADAYRAVDVRPPVPVVGGRPRSVEDVLGDLAPPHVTFGRAIQNLLRIVTVENVLLDPLAFTLYAVQPLVETVRYGRVKPAAAVMGQYVETIPAAYVAGTRSYQNYYHWMVETMPRTMRLHAESGGAELLTHRFKPGFHEGLQRLDGLDLDLRQIEATQFLERAVTTTIATNFQPWPKGSRYTLPAEEILAFPRAVAPSLRDRPRRVFISRRDVQTRVLNDEARLVAELEARGFDCPVASDLTLEDQAALCANAEIIVSTHGAGFANMLYRADQPCKIVEVVPVRRWPFHNLVCMYNLSQVCGFDHYLYDCGYQSDETRLLSQNWTVDHGEFLAFIDSLL